HGRAWLKAIMPFALISGMDQLNRNIDLVILGLFEAASGVGIYRVATRGAMLVALGVTAVNQLTKPYFARFYNTHDNQQLQRLATVSARANFLLALPATLAFWFFGKPIIAFVFGQEYTGAYWPLAILAGAHMI